MSWWHLSLPLTLSAKITSRRRSIRVEHYSCATLRPSPLLWPLSWVDQLSSQLLFWLKHLILHHGLRGNCVWFLTFWHLIWGLTWFSRLRVGYRIQIIRRHLVPRSRSGHVFFTGALLLNSVHPLTGVFDTLRALRVLVRTFHASFRICIYH